VSKDETSTPTPKSKISTTETPAPLWSGKVFSCPCTAEFQLEAGDSCRVVETTAAGISIEAPPCWTCERVNRVEIPIEPDTEGDPS
jgi:hypothetical protein